MGELKLSQPDRDFGTDTLWRQLVVVCAVVFAAALFCVPIFQCSFLSIGVRNTESVPMIRAERVRKGELAVYDYFGLARPKEIGLVICDWTLFGNHVAHLV